MGFLNKIQMVSTRQNSVFLTRNMQSMSDPDNRVHPTLKPLQASTGRMSMTGPAMQTVKGPLRACVVPYQADHVLMSIDSAQQEPRIAAGLAGEWRLIEAIKRGEKPHEVTARLMFGEDYTDEQYKYGKIGTLASLYGGGAKAIRDQTGCTDLQARSIKTMWSKAYGRIVEWGKEQAALGQDIYLASGRRVMFDHERTYRALNSWVQGTARDLFASYVYDVCVSLGYEDMIVLLLHDEILFSVPLNRLDEVVGNVSKVMSQDYMGVPFSCDVEIFPERWGVDGQKYDNKSVNSVDSVPVLMP